MHASPRSNHSEHKPRALKHINKHTQESSSSNHHEHWCIKHTNKHTHKQKTGCLLTRRPSLRLSCCIAKQRQQRLAHKGYYLVLQPMWCWCTRSENNLVGNTHPNICMHRLEAITVSIKSFTSTRRTSAGIHSFAATT